MHYINIAFGVNESRDGSSQRKRVYEWTTWLLHIVLVALTAVTGLGTCLSLGWTSRMFQDGGCLLYARMHLTLEANATREILVIDNERTVWGPHLHCTFCTYANAALVTYTVLWLWMYLMLHKWIRKR